MIKKFSLIVLFSIIASVQSVAHDFWIHSTSYTLPWNKLGAITNLYMGHGHLYPVDEFFDGDVKFKIVQPDNKEKIIEEKLLGYKETLKKEGTYIVSGKTNPAFWTYYFDDKGNKSWKAGPKQDVKNIISSKQYNKFAKAILDVGETKDENYSKVLGDALEIIPMENPNKLVGNGQYLTVKILFKNEPFASSKVYGSYAGFSNNGDYAFVTTTNKDGLAKIKLSHSGYWILKTDYSEAASKELEDKVNEIFYVATLTFQAQ